MEKLKQAEGQVPRDLNTPPPMLDEVIAKFKKIKYFVIDADNNLWDWVTMHVTGMHDMAVALSDVTGIPYEVIQASMKRVYQAAKTLDFSNLVESMDVIQAYAATQAESIMLDDVEDTRRARAAMQANIVAELTIVAKKAYDKNREENFELYPGIKEVFEVLSKNRNDIKMIILTDAPHLKTRSRLKRFGLEKYVSKMYGQIQKPLRFDDVEFEAEYEYLKPYFESIKTMIPYLVNYSERALLSAGDMEVPFQCVVLDENERKPDIDLARRLSLTPEEVSEQVVVWGDNAEKDGGLAVNNEVAAYLYSDYGQTRDMETIERMIGFGSTQEVERNLSAGDEALAKLQKLQDERIAQEIQKNRTQFLKIVHSAQVTDAFNEERPDRWKEAA